MATLNLEIVGFNDALHSLKINGKPVKIIKNKNANRQCVVQCDSPTSEISISKTNYYTGPLWWLWNSLYFLISIFGMFDLRMNKNFLVVDCRFYIDTATDAEATLNILDFEDGGKFLEITSKAFVEEKQNIQCFDKTAQKRHKAMKKIKLGLFFAAVIACILAVVLIK